MNDEPYEHLNSCLKVSWISTFGVGFHIFRDLSWPSQPGTSLIKCTKCTKYELWKKAFVFKSATALKLPASPLSVLVTTSCTSWWTMPPPHEGHPQDVEDEMNWGDPPPQEGDGRGRHGEAGGAGGGSVAGPGRSGRKVLNRLSSFLLAMAVKFGW